MVKERLLFFTAVILALLLGKQQNLHAQATLGARELSMGQATTVLPESPWSVFANPAMIEAGKPTVSFFGVRYYGFSEITDLAAVVIYPLKFGSFGFGAHRFGDDLYNENRLRVAYKNAFQGFHYGVLLNYNHVSIGGDYGSVGALGIDAGLAAQVAGGLWIGAKATNLNRPMYGDYSTGSEELARDLSIGLSYSLSDVALFSTDLVKDVRFPVSYRAGVEVTILGQLRGRAGITTEPVTFSGGFGYKSQVWNVNIGVQQHENPVLGLSPALDIQVSW